MKWEAHGLECVARISASGVPVGYVGLPKEHPDYGKDYDDIRDVQVHGGLTFADHWRKDPEFNHELWYVGFDCGHAWDIGDRGEADMLVNALTKNGWPRYMSGYISGFMTVADKMFNKPPSGPSRGPKNLAFVSKECERLAEQMAKRFKK